MTRLVSSEANVLGLNIKPPFVKFTSALLTVPFNVVVSTPDNSRLKCSVPVILPSRFAPPIVTFASESVTVIISSLPAPVIRVLLIFNVVFSPTTNPSWFAKSIVDCSSPLIRPLIFIIPSLVVPKSSVRT